MTGSYLLISSENNRPVPLVGKPCWIIGRGRSADIVIENPVISRRHAMLQIMDSGDVYLVDFGSRNGSFLNGFRVSVPVRLSDGDHLSFGDFAAEFHSIGTNRSATVNTVAGTVPFQQRRLLSVLVMDIRDFTVLSRDLGEEMLSRLIGNFFARAGGIIRTHHSRIDKYIGDALMAVWFHEDERSDANILQPLASACDVYKMTLELNREFELPFVLRIGAGVNTGYAMVGNAGSGDRADFTALGDTVNAAFRLESASKTIGADVVIGDMTHRRLLQRLGPVEAFIPHRVHLKGYEGEATVHVCSYTQLETLLNKNNAHSH